MSSMISSGQSRQEYAFGPALEVFLFEDITAEYKSEYDIDYAVKRHHWQIIIWWTIANNLNETISSDNPVICRIGCISMAVCSMLRLCENSGVHTVWIC